MKKVKSLNGWCSDPFPSNAHGQSICLEPHYCNPTPTCMYICRDRSLAGSIQYTTVVPAAGGND